MTNLSDPRSHPPLHPSGIQKAATVSSSMVAAIAGAQV